MKLELARYDLALGGSHPARGAWIEIFTREKNKWVIESHPARGAWIEIHSSAGRSDISGVAPRKGCVD